MKKILFVGTSPYKFRSSTPPPRVSLSMVPSNAERFLNDTNSICIEYLNPHLEKQWHESDKLNQSKQAVNNP